MDETQILAENITTKVMFLFVVIAFAVLVPESCEFIIQMLFGARVDELLHWIECGIMTIAGSREANAGFSCIKSGKYVIKILK